MNRKGSKDSLLSAVKRQDGKRDLGTGPSPSIGSTLPSTLFSRPELHLPRLKRKERISFIKEKVSTHARINLLRGNRVREEREPFLDMFFWCGEDN